jgi:hypothetical protein
VRGASFGFLQDEQSNYQTKTTELKSSLLSRLFKDDHKYRKKRNDVSFEKSCDGGSASMEASLASLGRGKTGRKDARGSDRGSEVSSLDDGAVSHSR